MTQHPDARRPGVCVVRARAAGRGKPRPYVRKRTSGHAVGEGLAPPDRHPFLIAFPSLAGTKPSAHSPGCLRYIGACPPAGCAAFPWGKVSRRLIAVTDEGLQQSRLLCC